MSVHPNQRSASGLSRTMELTVAAMGIVLVYLFTAVLNFRLPFAPNGGLVHLGNVPQFVVAILFGRRLGMLAGGLGLSLFDLLSGGAVWAPFTLVIAGAVGYTVGAVTEKKKTYPRYILGMVLACLINLAGYYVAEGLIYGNWIAPLTSIPGDLMQIGVSAGITLVIIEPLRSATQRTLWKNRQNLGKESVSHD